LYAEGYPEKPGALRKVSKELGITHPTLSRWAKGGASAPDAEVIRVAVTAMQDVIEGELDKILGAMENVRAKADYKTLAVAFGILFDKYQLIRGAPTSRTSALREELGDKSTAELERIIADADKMVEETFEKLEHAEASES
jgi:transcriptional regulator with XRE-family HTH domain